MEPAPFVDGWVLDALVEHFMALVRGDIRKLMVNIPPRHTKSSFLVAFRAWLWTINPTERILAASYNLGLSLRDNLRVRRIIEDPWFQTRYGTQVQLRPDQNAKYYYENTASGSQMAISVTGGVTGHGGSYLIIDDAHNASEAHSDVERESAIIWFREVWSNRLNDANKDRMIVVGQRIHENDVCGYILKERPDWTALILPAYYEPSRRCVTPIWSDPRSVEGELLWPERFSVETLEGLKRDLGSLGFAAQYQQLPAPAGGAVFKSSWFRYFTEADSHYELEQPERVKRVLVEKCHTFITVDLAISQKQTADYTVMSVWRLTPDRELLLIDCIREHFDNPEQQKQIQLLYQRYQPIYILIESVAYQLAILQQLLRQGIPVREYKPVKDKVSRASTAAVFYEAGRIYHPKSAIWKQIVEDELLMFPMAEHDDVVDTIAMAADAIGGPHMTATDHISQLQQRLARVQPQRGAA
jgi:predicted phage terminase large subunit-like protein